MKAVRNCFDRIFILVGSFEDSQENRLLRKEWKGCQDINMAVRVNIGMKLYFLHINCTCTIIPVEGVALHFTHFIYLFSGYCFQDTRLPFLSQGCVNF